MISDSGWRSSPPTGEVQQVISISAQRTQGKLANALGIEKGVGPGDFVPVLIEQAIGTRHWRGPTADRLQRTS